MVVDGRILEMLGGGAFGDKKVEKVGSSCPSEAATSQDGVLSVKPFHQSVKFAFLVFHGGSEDVTQRALNQSEPMKSDIKEFKCEGSEDWVPEYAVKTCRSD